MNISGLTEREQFLTYWLLRAYEALSRAGWEEGPSAEETRDRLCDVLANMELDPNLSDEAAELLSDPPTPLYILPPPPGHLPPDVAKQMDLDLEAGINRLARNQAESRAVGSALRKTVKRGRKDKRKARRS